MSVTGIFANHDPALASELFLISSDKELLSCWRQGFSHLQHGMLILFVCKLTRNQPPLIEIELHGIRIRPNDPKAAGLVTSGSYLSFTLREQSASNTFSAMVVKYP